MTFATVNGVQLRYDWQAGDGEPLVLLHEMGGALESWDLVVRALPDRAILRPDLRGFGLSEKPAGEIAMEDLVGDVTALMDHVGIGTAHLAGCAVGGGVAIAAAGALGKRCSRLTAFAPATGVPAERRSAVLGLADFLAREGIRGFLEGDTIPKAWPEPRFDRNGEGFAIFLQTQLGTSPDMLAATYRMLAGLDLGETLKTLDCETLFVAGTHDIARTPAIVSQIASKVRDSKFLEIDSSHFMALQSPGLVAKILS
ncbi:MAG: alpha/beta fold hydrolase [Notoacmeibacter sp.]|nr:alpha/beta fold hydrolase [Notoacmeibacter sp.]